MWDLAVLAKQNLAGLSRRWTIPATTKRETGTLDMLAGTKQQEGPGTLKLDDGRVLQVTPWSLRKFAIMGQAITRIMNAGLGIANRERTSDYDAAVKIATAAGLEKGQDGWPDIEDFEGFTMTEMVALIPGLVQEATDEVAFVISESLTNREQKITTDQVLDDFSWSGDIPRAVMAIIEINFTGDSALGEWRSLFHLAKGRLLKQA